MAWQFLLLAVLSADSPQDFRDFPPILKTRALIGWLESHRLEGEDAFRIARQAQAAAAEVDIHVEAKNYPSALKTFGSPELTMARAWTAYEKHRDPLASPRLPFPARLKSTPARCEHEEVDRVEAYLDLALQAGSEDFAAALLTLRSPVEIGSALPILRNWNDPRAIPLGVELVGRLRRAISSRREYDAAKDLSAQVRQFSAFAPDEFRGEIEEALQFYESRSRSLPPCESGAAAANDGDPDFNELKRRVMELGEASGREFEYAEQLLKLYRLAGTDQSRLDELESSGNNQLRILIGELRKAAASQANTRRVQ
jgi:hypothetical protein